VPVLKDLPWWVFGIRYLTGYDSKEKKERELIISIQAEIVDSALVRLRKAKALEKAAIE
jgi:type IV pilus assembly protein PilQ